MKKGLNDYALSDLAKGFTWPRVTNESREVKQQLNQHTSLIVNDINGRF